MVTVQNGFVVVYKELEAGEGHQINEPECTLYIHRSYLLTLVKHQTYTLNLLINIPHGH